MLNRKCNQFTNQSILKSISWLELGSMIWFFCCRSWVRVVGMLFRRSKIQRRRLCTKTCVLYWSVPHRHSHNLHSAHASQNSNRKSEMDARKTRKLTYSVNIDWDWICVRVFAFITFPVPLIHKCICGLMCIWLHSSQFIDKKVSEWSKRNLNIFFPQKHSRSYRLHVDQLDLRKSPVSTLKDMWMDEYTRYIQILYKLESFICMNHTPTIHGIVTRNSERQRGA